jgi:hypothetical protein
MWQHHNIEKKRLSHDSCVPIINVENELITNYIHNPIFNLNVISNNKGMQFYFKCILKYVISFLLHIN